MMTQGELFPSLGVEIEGHPIHDAARATIEALKSTGVLDASHSLKVELILQGSRALDREFKRDKLSVATTTLLAKLVDVAEGLPTVQQAVNDTFITLVEALQNAE